MAGRKASAISAALGKLRDAMGKSYGKGGAGEVAQDDMEELVKFATEIITKDYYADVRGVGQDIIRQIKDGEIKDEEGLSDAISQDVGGTGRIIYTFQAKLGLLATDNADAYQDEMGSAPDGPEAQLQMAMERDVREWLESHNVDELLRGDDEDED